MALVILLHGAYGNPAENWLPWLKAQLERRGHEVLIPAMPTPEGQTLEAWRAAFAPVAARMDAACAIVGHSIGATFALRVLEEHQARAAFLVSGFASALGDARFDAINRTFWERPFAWERVRAHCPSFHVLHGDGDPYVPIAQAEGIAHALGVQVAVVPKGGHLNAAAGFTEFPLLRDLVLLDLA